MLRAAGGGAGGVSSYISAGVNTPMRSTVPLIWPSNGLTMTAGGAFTLAAALPYSVPAGYMLLPANIVLGQQAFYYAQFTSTTAGTVYQNIYSGTSLPLPVMPASPTAATGVTTGAWTTPAAPIAFYNNTPGAQPTSPNGYFEIYAAFTAAGATARTYTLFTNTIATPIGGALTLTSGTGAVAALIANRTCPSGFASPYNQVIGGYMGGNGSSTTDGQQFISSSLGVGCTTSPAGATDSVICEMMYVLVYN